MKAFGVDSSEGSNCSFAVFPLRILGKLLNRTEVSFPSYKMGTITLHLQDACNKLNINISIYQNLHKYQHPFLGVYHVLDILSVSAICMHRPV